MSENSFLFQNKTFVLNRYPLVSKTPLRAWDAADELALNWTEETSDIGSLWLVNDQFGVLATLLSEYNPTSICDSFLGEKALDENCRLNAISRDQINFTRCPSTPITSANTVIIKVPKNLALFEYQLQQITNSCEPGTKVVAAAMIKHLPARAFDLLNRYIGDTSTSLAKKKARLIFATLDNRALKASYSYPTSYQVPNSKIELLNHANVFSRESIDIGTRFMLEHLPHVVEGERVIDLACGNGILGIHLARNQPAIKLSFYDESYMALASAEANCRNLLNSDTHTSFQADNCLESASDDSADLIINNPPFHQGQVVGDHLAWQMFNDAYRVLTKKGRLIIVGNRHLGYHIKLKKIFGNAKQLAANKKFVIIEAKKL